MAKAVGNARFWTRSAHDRRVIELAKLTSPKWRSQRESIHQGQKGAINLWLEDARRDGLSEPLGWLYPLGLNLVKKNQTKATNAIR